MTSIISALIPILALIVLGFALKASRFLPEGGWSSVEKLSYYVFFPALLVRSLAGKSLGNAPWQAMAFVVFATLMTATIILIAWHKLRRSESGPTFTSIFQGGVRFNSYISLALAQAFYGADGLTFGSLAVGFMVVLNNVLCVSAFSVWGTSSGRGMKALIRDIALNPLILGCIIGWLLSASGIGLPGVTKEIMDIISRAALPLGLMAVGAALNLEAVHGHLSSITISSIVQFGVKPLVALGFMALVGLSGVAGHSLLIAFMTPTAASAYILARQMGGDTETMASIITVQTLIAFVIMPVLVKLLL
jgi:malonate transporter